jgi:hypothetical protein
MMDDLNIYKIDVIESNDNCCQTNILLENLKLSKFDRKSRTNERHINYRKCENIDFHFNYCNENRLLVSFTNDSGLKYGILELSSPEINNFKLWSLKEFRDLNISSDKRIKKLFLLNGNKFLLCVSDDHYSIYHILLETIIFQYKKPNITFIDISENYLVMGQKLGTVSLYLLPSHKMSNGIKCVANCFPIMVLTTLVKVLINKEIIEIKVFESNGKTKLIILAKGIYKSCHKKKNDSKNLFELRRKTSNN